jgi:translation initiation factor IF-2
VDTPGHEAFTEMRARGANVTDIAVLVVAADDGVMPQTEEAISHARAAEVPIVVALNKIDLPGINLDRVYTGLSTNELQPSEWGGEIEVVKTSATKGTGIDELLDTLLTVAELHEYKANPKRPAIGTCLEAQQDSERGIVAKLLVQTGTLRVGDTIVCGQAHGRVKAMFDTLDEHRRVAEAGPSVPVNITGFDQAPSAGSHFYVLDDIAKAREIAAARTEQERYASLGATGFRHVTLESLFDRLDLSGEPQTLNIILRADVRGSIEAIEKELSKLEHPEVRVKLLQKSVGGITEADVTLAHASDAIIIGFNVVPDEKARALAEKTGVQVRRYDVIYKITDDLKLALEGMLKPEEREVEQGRVLVQQVFKISRVGTVAGCRVLAGVVERSSRARVIRNSTIVGDYALDTLRREKDDTKEVREGYECGIKLAGFNDVKEGDLFEIYKVEEIHRKFES